MRVPIFRVARSPHARVQRGLSLVELMVGITIGLFVVAAASLVVTSQLTDNRRLLLELQVQQDLRATADVITRELRRAGGRQLPTNGVWSEIAAATANPFDTVTLAAGNTEVRFDYERGIGLQPLGFKLDATRGVIQSYIGTGWQDLTDSSTMTVTAFTVTPRTAAVLERVIPCPKLCLAGNNLCWPKLKVRSYVVTIEARARTDDRIKRRLVNEVRLRNDEFWFDSAEGLSALQPCPL